MSDMSDILMLLNRPRLGSAKVIAISTKGLRWMEENMIGVSNYEITVDADTVHELQKEMSEGGGLTVTVK